MSREKTLRWFTSLRRAPDLQLCPSWEAWAAHVAHVSRSPALGLSPAASSSLCRPQLHPSCRGPDTCRWSKAFSGPLHLELLKGPGDLQSPHNRAAARGLEEVTSHSQRTSGLDPPIRAFSDSVPRRFTPCDHLRIPRDAK